VQTSILGGSIKWVKSHRKNTFWKKKDDCVTKALGFCAVWQLVTMPPEFREICEDEMHAKAKAYGFSVDFEKENLFKNISCTRKQES
jgi:hypothetical protein